MATVPAYGPRKVRTEALPGVRRTAAETNASTGVGVAEAEARSALQQGEASARKWEAGAGLANQVGQSVQQVAQIVIAEQRKADEIQGLANENQLAAWVNKRLYDPETGALGVKGKDAMPLPEQVLKDFNEFAGGLEGGLPNDRQKADFAKQRRQVEQNLDLTVRRHVFNQMQAYDASETTAAIENNVNAAITNANDPRLIGQSLDRAISAAEGFAKRNGVGPAEAQKQVEAIQTKTHVGVIENLLAQENTKAADVYFQEVRDAGQLKGEALARVEKALEAGKTKKEAQTQADAILAAGGTLAQQREKAKQIDDPDVRDNVMARLEHEDALKEKENRDIDRANLQAAYALVDKTGSIEGLTPQQRVDVAEHMPALRAFALSRAKGVPIETDQATFYGLMRKAMDKPDEFVTDNLLAYRAKLGDADFQQLAGLQLSLSKGDKAKAEKDLGGFRTNTQIVDDSLTQYGIDPKPKEGTKEAQAIAQLRRMLDVRVQAQADLTGKAPQNKDIQAMIDDILGQTTKVEGSWWNIFPGGKPFFSSEKKLIETTIDDVPAADQAQITAALRAKGKPVTPATILDLYVETQARKAR